MARAIGCSVATISTLATPTTRIPSPQIIVAIAKLTGGAVGPADWFPEAQTYRSQPLQPPASNVKRRGRRRQLLTAPDREIAA